MPHIRPIRNEALLRERLEQLVATFDLTTLSPDPLEVVRRYDDPLDQEVVGILAAAFAYGRADIVVRNVTGVVEAMKPSPFRYLQTFDRKRAMKTFAQFSHRFHKGPELVDLLERLATVVADHGSLGELFRVCYDERDADLGPSLQRFVSAIIDSRVPQASSPAFGRNETRKAGGDARGTRALRYLLTSPEDGSACKRMNLYLRWMVRRESPDLGLWDFADPAKLLMPIDTHIHRIATFLGLNKRKSADWKTARALTDRLARFAPADPVRYDFALCRLGILALCSRQKKKENCDVCMLRDVCRFPVK